LTTTVSHGGVAGTDSSIVPGDFAADRGTTAAAVPEVPVAVRTSCLSSREAGKALIFTPVRESSGESRLNTSGHTVAPSGDSEKAANDQRCP